MTVSDKSIQHLEDVASKDTEDAKYAKALLYAIENNE